jgi:hypothetical protein
VAWGFFGAAYLACYLLSTALPTPLLWYHPVGGHFTFEVQPAGLAINYYGRLLFSLLAGGVGYLLGLWLSSRLAPEARVRWLTRVTAWTAALLVFTVGLYLYTLIGRPLTPEPLPAGYVFR